MSGYIFSAYRIIFGRMFFARLNKLVHATTLKALGIFNYESDEVSGEAHFVRHEISKIESGVVFDVGANIGRYSEMLRKSNGRIEIYCFEPHPKNFKLLKAKESALNLKAFQYGVGSLPSVMKLYDYADGDGSSHASLYKGVIEEIHGKTSVVHDVNVISLSDFSAERRIDRIALLKIDTEGHEFEVLKGFESYIKSGKIDIIHFEFNEMNVASRVFFKDFWDFLPNYNFFRMLPGELLPIKTYNPLQCEIFAYQNIVAKLKAVAQR